MTTFDLLNPKVQHYVYRQKWNSFRPIQDEAIDFIVNQSGNLVICAPTASGKTEAAFLPIVSTLVDNYSNSFRAIYVSPLKALINDQFSRIDLLCKDIGIPVTKWHGDVGQTVKQKAITDPRGILLITPESLEATLLNKPAIARAAFSKLTFVVIDEIHSFIGTERGAQLRSLLARIGKISNVCPRIIALSATIGNPDDVARWLSSDAHFKVIRDEDWSESSGVEGLIRGFTSKTNLDDSALVEMPGYCETIVKSFQAGKNLIFGNSKKKLEETAYLVKQLATNAGLKTDFLIHHGSLAKGIREGAENQIKESVHATSIFCTSTLEMGIDIGAIEKVGILDPPWAVSGFAQRIGRSGRRAKAPKKFECFISHNELSDDSNLSELMREDLTKTVAIVLLYLEGFVEPLVISRSHLSTLVHQTLSFVVQCAGASKTTITEVILDAGFRGAISHGQFDILLSHLVDVGVLHLDSSGQYSAGRIGEKLVEHYEFYSVFLTSDQWSVVTDGQVIGDIPLVGMYRINDHILLGGRVWVVREVVEQAKRLIVVPAKKAKAPIFNASFGITHPRIHKKMFDIYSSDEDYPFLNVEGKRLLAEGRTFFRTAFGHETESFRLPIFEGTVIQNTVSILLDLAKIPHGVSEVCLEVVTSRSTFESEMKALLGRFKTGEEIASLISRDKKQVEKFERFLNNDLLNHGYASRYLDIDGTRAWFQSMQAK